MIIPKTIKVKPITLPQLNSSFKNNIPKIKTNDGARLMKGYASVMGNLRMAASQNIAAKKAEKRRKKYMDQKELLVFLGLFL